MAKAVSASQNGLTRVYRNDDGSVTVLRGGGRNWRNNNPGNIKYGGNAKAAGAIWTVSLQGGYDTPSPPVASAPAPNAPEETIVDAPAVRRSDIRRLTRRDVTHEADVFASGAAPVPYLPYR